HHGTRATDLDNAAPPQLVDKIANLIGTARNLDRRAIRPRRQNLRASLQQRLELGGRNLGDDQLTAVHLVACQVLDLDDLDQPLELLAHLVGLGVAVVDLQGDPRTAGLAARAYGDPADMKTAAADHTRDLGQRVLPVLDKQ